MQLAEAEEERAAEAELKLAAQWRLVDVDDRLQVRPLPPLPSPRKEANALAGMPGWVGNPPDPPGTEAPAIRFVKERQFSHSGHPRRN